MLLQEAEGGALASFTGTMRYSSGLIADQKRTAAALVRVSKMMGKVRHCLLAALVPGLLWTHIPSHNLSRAIHFSTRVWSKIVHKLAAMFVR